MLACAARIKISSITALELEKETPYKQTAARVM